MNSSANLNIVYEKINNVEQTQESLQSVKESISCTEKVESLGSHVSSNTDNLRAFTYK